MRVFAISLLGLLLALAACVSTPPPTEILVARADLLDEKGIERGEVDIAQLDTGIRLVVRVRGIWPGVHGAHIHTIGACEPFDFASAGGHWNPLNRVHGRESEEGQHLGDLPNILVSEHGTGVLEATINGARISGGPYALLDGDGSAIIIHAMADDYLSQPSGEAGRRTACGVIEPIFD